MKVDDVLEINKKCPDGQGIFFQPTMIPVNIKEHVIYRRFKTSAMEGGNCWGSVAEYVEYDEENEDWVALDLILEKIKPDISYLKYKKIQKLVHTNKETWEEYYGNSTDWKVEYIILSELENFLQQ